MLVISLQIYSVYCQFNWFTCLQHLVCQSSSLISVRMCTTAADTSYIWLVKTVFHMESLYLSWKSCGALPPPAALFRSRYRRLCPLLSNGIGKFANGPEKLWISKCRKLLVKSAWSLRFWDYLKMSGWIFYTFCEMFTWSVHSILITGLQYF